MLTLAIKCLQYTALGHDQRALLAVPDLGRFMVCGETRLDVKMEGESRRKSRSGMLREVSQERPVLGPAG